MKNLLVNLLINFCYLVARLVISLAASMLIGMPMIDFAAAERGLYGAFGGEWLIILGAFGLVFYLTGKMYRSVKVLNVEGQELHKDVVIHSRGGLNEKE